MISLELARKLKEAGLEWEPKELDCISAPADVCASAYLGKEEMEEIQSFSNEEMKTLQEKIVWLPRLDQLLAEIERRGYGYDLHTLTTNHEHKYYCAIKLLECACGYRIDNISWGPFKADNPEDAAAKALIWVLERKKGEQG